MYVYVMVISDKCSEQVILTNCCMWCEVLQKNLAAVCHVLLIVQCCKCDVRTTPSYTKALQMFVWDMYFVLYYYTQL